jgi:hypothetical protein
MANVTDLAYDPSVRRTDVQHLEEHARAPTRAFAARFARLTDSRICRLNRRILHFTRSCVPNEPRKQWSTTLVGTKLRARRSFGHLLITIALRLLPLATAVVGTGRVISTAVRVRVRVLYCSSTG